MKKYNVYHRKDGRWEGRILKEKLPDGTRKYHYIFGHTHEEVYQKICEFLNSKPQTVLHEMTVAELFCEWKQSVQHRIKESTLANYQMKAKKHILPVFGENTLSTVTSSDIYAFIDNKIAEGLSGRYVSDIIVLMKTIFKYAQKVYHIISPLDDVELPRKKKPDIRLLDNKEQMKLQKYIAENRSNTTLGISLSMTTGLRLGEICALQWEDIDLKKRILTVRKTMQRIQCTDSEKKTNLIVTEPKSESSCRTLPLPDCIMDFLCDVKGNDSDFVISGTERPIEPRTMQYRFSAVLRNAGVPPIHFHALRHMFASNCIELGFDIKSLSEILGHSSVEITLNRYVHSSFEQKKQYMKRLKMSF